MEQIRQYANCFSLGWFCGTASSLSRLGLRNFSGPFDWCFSDFDSVISQIDNEFIDFMKKENLETIRNKPTEFRDKKYNFHYNHDIIADFDMEYPDIYAKYIKRAKRFTESIRNPTCFFRAVRSEKEVKFIASNADRIEGIIKRYNPGNLMVYILLNNMHPLPNHLKWFRLSSEQYTGKTYEMRNMFHESMELVQFCGSLFEPGRIILNKEFDSRRNGQGACAAEINYYVSNDIDGVDKKILNMLDLQSCESFYIWGGGRYGIPLYRYLTQRGVKVKAVIDNRSGDEFQGDICIVPPSDIEDHSKIFIAVSNEKSNYEIKEQVKEKKCRFLTYRELVCGI